MSIRPSLKNYPFPIWGHRGVMKEKENKTNLKMQTTLFELTTFGLETAFILLTHHSTCSGSRKGTPFTWRQRRGEQWSRQSCATATVLHARAMRHASHA